MSIWSWFFPSDADKVQKAKKWVEQEEWADARNLVLGIDTDEAKQILETCEVALCRMNLDAAVSWADAGDDDRVQHHLEVAENFRRPGAEEDFKVARRQLREIREAREAEKKRIADEHAAAATAALPDLSFDETELPETEDEQSAARIALIVENYDAELRPLVGKLGKTFAQALLDHEDGRPDLAVQGLVQLPDDNPVVRFERARAAYALGDARATSRELVAFAELHGKHAAMGRHHTAMFLASVWAETGRIDEALALIRGERQKSKDFAGPLYAQLLEVDGQLDEAEAVLVGLVRQYSKDSALYALLGRVRAAKGNRMGAMTTLEAGIEACTCSPGTCGFRPPDVRLYRSLATLYLEDGLETPRALDLAEQAAGLVQQPTWEDAYLQALVAKVNGLPEAPQMAANLLQHTPAQDPRRARLEQHLG